MVLVVVFLIPLLAYGLMTSSKGFFVPDPGCDPDCDPDSGPATPTLTLSLSPSEGRKED